MATVFVAAGNEKWLDSFVKWLQYVLHMRKSWEKGSADITLAGVQTGFGVKAQWKLLCDFELLCVLSCNYGIRLI